MDFLPLVFAVAVSWHASLFWIERSRHLQRKTELSLPKLLQLAERDLLVTLRGELTRLSGAKPGLPHERKLREVEHWLGKMGDGDAGGIDV
ncbi:MAG: hypothetical protein QMC89_05920 [Candidatus Hodarchaeaceae archaeon]|nr:hypothetical protein [Candidatus Hodarchaeaceae archaeon]